MAVFRSLRDCRRATFAEYSHLTVFCRKVHKKAQVAYISQYADEY